MSPRKKVDELKDKIYKGEKADPVVPGADQDKQVVKAGMDFTNISGIGKAKNEEIIKKLEELGVDTKPKPDKAEITIPTKEFYRVVFNDILAKEHTRKKFKMALDEQELDALARATDPFLALHGGNWLAHFVELNFAVTVAGILTPRVVMSIKQLIEKRKRGTSSVVESEPEPELIPEPEPEVKKKTKKKASK